MADLISKIDVLWSKIDVLWSKIEILWSKIDVSWSKIDVSWSKIDVSWSKIDALWSKISHIKSKCHSLANLESPFNSKPNLISAKVEGNSKVFSVSDTSSKLWTCIGMRIASNVAVVTADWARWDPRYTPKETCCSAKETISGELKIKSQIKRPVWKQSGLFQGKKQSWHPSSAFTFMGKLTKVSCRERAYSHAQQLLS